MLKLVAGLVAGATLLTVGTVSAFASSQGNCFGGCQKTRVCDTTNCSAQCYVDADNDGVCDNRGPTATAGPTVWTPTATACVTTVAPAGPLPTAATAMAMEPSTDTAPTDEARIQHGPRKHPLPGPCIAFMIFPPSGPEPDRPAPPPALPFRRWGSGPGARSAPPLLPPWPGPLPYRRC